MVRAFESVSGRPLPFTIAPRRPGDIASCFAKVDLAARELGWKATLGLKEMCESTWRFQQRAAGL
jgi:UDP-glucose 4-epimerase